MFNQLNHLVFLTVIISLLFNSHIAKATFEECIELPVVGLQLQDRQLRFWELCDQFDEQVQDLFESGEGDMFTINTMNFEQRQLYVRGGGTNNGLIIFDLRNISAIWNIDHVNGFEFFMDRLPYPYLARVAPILMGFNLYENLDIEFQFLMINITCNENTRGMAMAPWGRILIHELAALEAADAADGLAFNNQLGAEIYQHEVAHYHHVIDIMDAQNKSISSAFLTMLAWADYVPFSSLSWKMVQIFPFNIKVPFKFKRKTDNHNAYVNDNAMIRPEEDYAETLTHAVMSTHFLRTTNNVLFFFPINNLYPDDPHDHLLNKSNYFYQPTEGPLYYHGSVAHDADLDGQTRLNWTVANTSVGTGDCNDINPAITETCKAHCINDFCPPNYYCDINNQCSEGCEVTANCPEGKICTVEKQCVDSSAVCTQKYNDCLADADIFCNQNSPQYELDMCESKQTLCQNNYNDCLLQIAYCGNGIVDINEECDDGNHIYIDECDNQCKLTYCGNGIMENNEQCDDGNNINDDQCTNQCEKPVCGNGVKENNEQCDDGNQANDDGCDNDCTLSWVCGDGIIEGGEQCDDGNNINADACLSSCKLAKCGDGIKWTNHEECDDGNNNDNDLCRNNCQLPTCGDGIIQGNEDCDSQLGCLANCQWDPSCNDGWRENLQTQPNEDELCYYVCWYNNIKAGPFVDNNPCWI